MRDGRPSDRTAFCLTSANRCYYWFCGILRSRLTHLLTHYFVICVSGMQRASFARKAQKQSLLLGLHECVLQQVNITGHLFIRMTNIQLYYTALQQRCPLHLSPLTSIFNRLGEVRIQPIDNKAECWYIMYAYRGIISI